MIIDHARALSCLVEPSALDGAKSFIALLIGRHACDSSWVSSTSGQSLSRIRIELGVMPRRVSKSQVNNLNAASMERRTTSRSQGVRAANLDYAADVRKSVTAVARAARFT